MLDQTPNLISTDAMAAVLEISTQMLGRYRARGVVSAEVSRGPRGGLLWDPEKVRAQFEKNRKAASRHGGVRYVGGARGLDGAGSRRAAAKKAGGRKKKGCEPGRVGREDGLRSAFSVVEILKRVAERREPPSDAVQVNGLLYYRPSELEAVVKCAEAVGLTIAHLSALEAWLKVQEKARDLEVKRGTLVEASEVKRLHTLRLEEIRQRLAEIPAKVATDIGAELGLDEAARARLRGGVQRVVTAQMSLLAVGGAEE